MKDTILKVIPNLNYTSLINTAENVNLNNHPCNNWVLNSIPKWILILIGPILLILGVIGNTLGFAMTFHGTMIYPNIILTRAMYAVNLINCLVMIEYPVLDLIGEFFHLPFSLTYAWNQYVAEYYFPLAKSLVCLSFGIYVLIALSQILGIDFPYKYRSWFNKRKIATLIFIYFIWSLLWYVPSRYWFKMIPILDDKNCHIYGIKSETEKLSYSKLIYIKQASLPTTPSSYHWAWTSYDILRESFTKFLPAIAVLIARLRANKKIKMLIKWPLEGSRGIQHQINNKYEKVRNSLSHIVSAGNNNNNDAIGHTNLPNIISEKVTKDFQKTNNSLKSLKPKTAHQKDIENNTMSDDIFMTNASSLPVRRMSSYHNLNNIEERILDNLRDFRMIMIMGFEFIVFLLPVSVFLITRDFIPAKWTWTESFIDIAFGICALLEDMYITLTFYLNLAFNLTYRQQFKKMCHTICKCFRIRS